MRRLTQLSVFLAWVLSAPLSASAAHPPVILDGFRLLYETKFEEARLHFLTWEKANPQDPLGHAWEAASYLFEEFYRQGVFTSQFFLDDRKFLDGVENKPNSDSRTAFFAASTAAEDLAARKLAANPNDAEALFALTVTTGMRADYASLIDKRQLESLRLIRQSEGYAKQLLRVRPDSADAYLALGAANYIISCLPTYKRFLLRLGGIKGDKQQGMAELSMAAQQGDYLRPFAKIMLAMASLRENQPAVARTELEDLTNEFPQNPQFARELALLKKSIPATSSVIMLKP